MGPRAPQQKFPWTTLFGALDKILRRAEPYFPKSLRKRAIIVIDMNTGQVIVKGPMTKEEKVVWDRLRAHLDECDREIEELTAMLKDRKNKRFRRFIEEDIVKSACAI